MKISVAIATYNGSQYIEKQIKSILRQTILPDEIIIVDDRSNDDTLSIIKKYENHKDISFEIYKNQENLGYKKNFLKTISKCKGEYIFLCDQDDEWDINKIEKMIRIMNNNDIAVLSSSFRLIDSDSKLLTVKKKIGFSNQNFYKRSIKKGLLVKVPINDLLFHNMAQGCAMVITKKVKDTFINNFDESLPHDWQLNLIGAIEDKSYFLNQELFSYRLHDKNTIGYGGGKTSMREKFNENVRLMTVYDCIKTVSFIKKVNYTYYKNNELVQQYYKFSKQHIKNILEKNLFELFLQNFDPIYFQVKSMKGRAMDILYMFKKEAS